MGTETRIFWQNVLKMQDLKFDEIWLPENTIIEGILRRGVTEYGYRN